MAEQLLNCPFCGREVIPNATPDGFLEHPDYGNGCPASDWLVMPDEWNTRAIEAQTVPREEYERAVAENERLREVLAEISELDGEINPSNYDHDDVCHLNTQFVLAVTMAREALSRKAEQ